MASEFNSMEDLAFSRSFRNWVLNKDAAERVFWESWVARNPDKAEMVKYAKAVIFAMHGKAVVLSEDEIDEEVRKSVARLREAPRYIPLDGPEGRSKRWMARRGSQRAWASAALAAGLVLAAYIFYHLHAQRDPLAIFLNNHKKVVMHKQIAGDGDDKTGMEDEGLNLPDESLVKLGRFSKLYYPVDRTSGTSRREVYLQGEALFDIRRNRSAPFFVYTDQVIVKALGTSFIVHSFPLDIRPSVAVLTGRVSVYRQEDFSGPAGAGPEPTGMLLTPNQEGIYDRSTGQWTRTLVKAPQPLEKNPDTSLAFEGTPVQEVFARLEELYGIPIQYDQDELAHCCVTIRLGKESYYGHLRAICRSIGGTYEVIDGNVVVTAPGCQGRSGGGSDR
jgi:hypothetical protein